ncbi:hypothetical protein [Halopiger djelfimassiliensis]|uniref:hypothetical protein n=1 Tax=Halopiger djelfimassiliensis TaxID=1293047 RepID=UPI0006776FF7|nr:hypothetical protein [Halopiger djelfimassiliensis]
MLSKAKDMTHAHLEDVGALVAGGVIGFPLTIGAANISYFGHDFSSISYEAAGATFGLGLIFCVIAGIVSLTTNDVRGDVSQLEKGAAATAVGLPLGYSFVPLVREMVHYGGQTTELGFSLLIVVAFAILAAMPNEAVKQNIFG